MRNRCMEFRNCLGDARLEPPGEEWERAQTRMGDQHCGKCYSSTRVHGTRFREDMFVNGAGNSLQRHAQSFIIFRRGLDV